MPINIKSQKDVLSTRVSIELPADLNEIDALMRASKSTGTVVATYNQGGIMGINIEQNKHIPQKVSENVREIVGITTKEM